MSVLISAGVAFGSGLVAFWALPLMIDGSTMFAMLFLVTAVICVGSLVGQFSTLKGVNGF